jgi:hypothetical protein
VINIYANNKFKPNLNSSEYKNMAKENFKRRMTYNPKGSIYNSKASSSLISPERSYLQSVLDESLE